MNKPIMVHNTLNNTKMEFKPLEPGKVKMCAGQLPITISIWAMPAQS